MTNTIQKQFRFQIPKASGLVALLVVCLLSSPKAFSRNRNAASLAQAVTTAAPSQAIPTAKVETLVNAPQKSLARPQDEGALGAASRLLITFKNGAVDPSDDGFLNHLSHETNASFSYMRKISGTTHLFEVRRVKNPKGLEEVVDRLKARGDIAGVELDGMMRRMSSEGTVTKKSIR